MTTEEFKSYPGCGHYTNEQAKEILNSLEKTAVILFEYTCQQNGMLIDNQLVVTSNKASNNQNFAA